MQINLDSYMLDGSCGQARATLACLQEIIDLEDYEVNTFFLPKVARWENGREQGYVVSCLDRNTCDQLNIAFFESRNSRDLQAILWEQRTLNSPNICSTQQSEDFKKAYENIHSVGYYQILEMAKWIKKEIESFYFSHC